MKLLTKTTLYFLSAMVPILAAAGFFLFHQFSKELNFRSDKELITDEIEWIRYLEAQSENGTTFMLKAADLSIYPVDASLIDYPVIKDVYQYDEKARGNILYRQLYQVVSVRGIPYQIAIKKSQEQKTALMTNVTRVMLLVFAGLFVATLIFNWVISKTLWDPFKASLVKIRSAELQKMETVHFGSSGIAEFNELNTSLNYMTGRIYNDYVNMKEFTENAAHEMQTPLAVVQSKLELLLQDNKLTEENVQLIVQASTALGRLRNLNKGLLLLAKIGNNQFESNVSISLTGISKKYLLFFYELIKDKELTIETQFENDFIIKLHPLLADTLVSNLIGNAVKYNIKGGRIVITIREDSYHISNTSFHEAIQPHNLFKRFKTPQDADETSNGLGLAIVKKIADTNRLFIAYSYENGVHNFEITRR